MTVTGRSAQATKKRRRIPCRHLATLMLLLGVPSIGLFSLQWSGLPTLADYGAPRAAAGVSLNPPAPLLPRTDGPGQTVPRKEPLSAKLERPFASVKSAMMTASFNPFHESLSAGVSQGVLVLREDEQEVPTYGLSGTSYRSGALSDRAILRQIRRSVGGTSVRAPGKQTALKPTDSETADANEENPFSTPGKSPAKQTSVSTVSKDAAEVDPVQASSRTDSTAQKEQTTASETAAGNKTAADPAPVPQQEGETAKPGAPVDTKPVEPATPVTYGMPAPSVGTYRPLAMLKMGTDGKFEAMAATTIVNRSTFDTVEYGLMPMNVLFFPKPAEIGTSVAVADFNKDSIPDVCFNDAAEGLLHLVYGNPDGTYTEEMRIEVGTGARSLAAGDFNNDGHTDIALSDSGIGNLTILYLGEPGGAPRFRTDWVSTYRDYIMGADRTGSGISDLIAATFVNLAEVLDIGQSKGAIPGTRFNLFQVLNRTVSNYYYYKFQLDAVLLNSSLSVNLQNSHAQMANILNVQAGIRMYFVIGDINFDNTIGLALATPRK